MKITSSIIPDSVVLYSDIFNALINIFFGVFQDISIHKYSSVPWLRIRVEKCAYKNTCKNKLDRLHCVGVI